MGKWEKSSPELVQRFEAAISWYPELEQRQMFGYPCAFLNGNMATGLHEQNWIARLDEADRETIESLGGLPFEVNGRSMKQYRLLPTAIQEDDKKLQEWLGKSVEFVGTLPAKPKKKKKAAKKKKA